MVNNFFEKKSLQNCKDIRKRILDISQKVTALHLGGTFSCVEILEAIYFSLLKKNFDRFVLSKGHAGILLYSVLEKLGYLKEKDLNEYCSAKGFLGVHPDYGTKGVWASTGSLGHGLGIAAGMALSTINKNNILYYVLISDGELMEGSIWEMAITIPKLKLKNIILIVDNNDFQSSTKLSASHPNLYPIAEKFLSFGWDVAKCNGHKTKDIINKIKMRKKNKPFVLVANTIKGYPVSFMIDNPIWHYRSPNKLEYLKALKEINSK